MEIVGGSLDGGIDRGGLPVDQRIGIEPFRGVVVEPRLAEAARALGLDDPSSSACKLDIVADAAAKRAGGVLEQPSGSSQSSSGCGATEVRRTGLRGCSITGFAFARTGRHDERSAQLAAE